MKKYIPVIGLEVHAELKTKSKMFCGCKNEPDIKENNVHICPICMGHPGTLPFVNKKAVELVLRVGASVGGECADFTEFDRKNYFYPDIPKNYQISQYKYPLISGGSIQGVALTRIHLEEDTARSLHTEKGSLIDFNRAGVPLMELVTEPVMHSAEKVLAFAKDLQLLLRYLNASDAHLEKGEMRVEVNISLKEENQEEFGTKVEVKNLNSFRAVFGAIEYEIERQKILLEKGESIIQETRGWNEEKQSTYSQRVKENAHDYRYFPDPDIPKYRLSEISEFSFEKIKSELPVLPWEVREILISDSVQTDSVEMLVAEREMYSLYEKTRAYFTVEKEEQRLRVLLQNYLTSDFVGIRNKYNLIDISYITPEIFRDFIKLVYDKTLSSRGAKNILEYMMLHKEEVEEGVYILTKKKGFIQISDTSELEKVVISILEAEENKKAYEEYKEGKENALHFLVGQCMKKLKGAGNPQVLQKIVQEKINI
jgi:aspartyl-tRNA(Asn)/glutamyl-tRNA(Gln) amidotransferase subunit B